jgi:hypothetical protein
MTGLQAGSAIAAPVMSFASGATNSMRGAAFLSGIAEAMVIDVAGRRPISASCAADFRARRIRSSKWTACVRYSACQTYCRSVSAAAASSATRFPLDRQRRLSALPEGLVFGGKTLTATDVTVGAGVARFGDTADTADTAGAVRLPRHLVRAALDTIHAKIEDAVDRIKTEAGDLPLLAVGGGEFLVPDRPAGISQVLGVPHGECGWGGDRPDRR